EEAEKIADFTTSLGLKLKEDGTISDSIPGMPAYEAGVAPGGKLIAVNGRKYSKQILKDAIAAGKKDHAAIELLIENGDFYTTHRIQYFEGLRQPHLEPDESSPDLLSKVIAPLTATQPS